MKRGTLPKSFKSGGHVPLCPRFLVHVSYRKRVLCLEKAFSAINGLGESADFNEKNGEFSAFCQGMLC